MAGRLPPERYPWWVKFSLLGAQTRTSQWFWVAASLLVGFVLIWFALGDEGIARILILIAASWSFVTTALYLATIRWMDRHGTWR